MTRTKPVKKIRTQNRKGRESYKRMKKKSNCKSNCFCQMNVKAVQGNGIFDALRKKEVFYDLHVQDSSGEITPAHKLILLNLGPKFQKAFYDKKGSKLQVIKLDASPIATRELVNFAYTGRCDIDRSNVSELMALGKEYEIKALLKLGSEMMVSALTQSNAIEMYKFSKEFFCPELRDYVKRFILQNFLSINSEEQGFGDCPTHDLEDFLKDDELNTTEEMLFEAIEHWVGNDKGRQEAISSMVKHVRFSLMHPDYFENKVETSPIVQHKPAAKPIAQAKSFFLKLSRARTTTMKLFQSRFYQKFRIPNEIVFAVGGWSADPNGPTTYIETYDIRASKWHNQKFAALAPRAYHGLAVVDKKIFLFGGYDGDEYFSAMTMYDPCTNVWEEKAPMYHARCYVSSAVLDGKIYAMGGFNGRTRLSSVECYDPKTNTWSLLPHMRIVRSDACSVAHGGKIYVIGGFTGQEIMDSVEVFDPVTNDWSFGPRLNRFRSGVKAIVYQQKIYVLGGFDGHRRLKTVECYNPSSPGPRWTYVADMITQRSNFSITIVDDKIFVMGGFEGSGVINKTEAFCGKTGSWSEYPPMNMRRSALSAVTLSGLPNSAFFVNRQTDVDG